jgi:hypothetical protein
VGSSAVAIVAQDRKSGEINLAVCQVWGVLALKKPGNRKRQSAN